MVEGFQSCGNTRWIYSRWRGFTLGTLYGIGIAPAYGILGVMVVSTGFKFGAMNASPWFNFGVAIIFLLLSLATFNAFYIKIKYQAEHPNCSPDKEVLDRFGVIGLPTYIILMPWHSDASLKK